MARRVLLPHGATSLFPALVRPMKEDTPRACCTDWPVCETYATYK